MAIAEPTTGSKQDHSGVVVKKTLIFWKNQYLSYRLKSVKTLLFLRFCRIIRYFYSKLGISSLNPINKL